MKKEQHKDQGQGLVEYALILVMVAIIVVVIVSVYGAQVGNMFSRVTSSMPG